MYSLALSIQKSLRLPPSQGYHDDDSDDLLHEYQDVISVIRANDPLFFCSSVRISLCILDVRRYESQCFLSVMAHNHAARCKAWPAVCGGRRVTHDVEGEKEQEVVSACYWMGVG